MKKDMRRCRNGTIGTAADYFVKKTGSVHRHFCRITDPICASSVFSPCSHGALSFGVDHSPVRMAATYCSTPFALSCRFSLAFFAYEERCVSCGSFPVLSYPFVSRATYCLPPLPLSVDIVCFFRCLCIPERVSILRFTIRRVSCCSPHFPSLCGLFSAFFLFIRSFRRDGYRLTMFFLLFLRNRSAAGAG